MEIKQVGIIGCGTMGSGIVQVCAQSGYPVIVSDINETVLNQGLKLISANLDKSVGKGKLTPENKRLIAGRIKGTNTLLDLQGCDLVIEAAVENLELKKRLFGELDNICRPQTILATNTSCLSITDIAVSTRSPERIIGMHFFNPAPLMLLVEIVRTLIANAAILDQAKAFVQSLGKTVVLAQDSPGFIVNRLLTPYILDAIRLLETNSATRDDIDNSIKLGLNHPLGPLATADLIGLDVLYFIAKAIYEELREPQYIPPLLLKKMVAAGWIGRKSKKGFYEYT